MSTYHGGVTDGERRDFFVSYTAVDRGWAEWIAWQLEDAGYTVLLQAWDMVPGSNWLVMMHQATRFAERTIAVLSPAYLDASVFGEAEWLAAYRRDPAGMAGRLIPIRVEDCTVGGLLAGIVYADLVGLSADEAKTALLEAVRTAAARRSKPLVQPRFPGSPTPAVDRPGPSPFPGHLPRAVEVIMPGLGEDYPEGTVVRWLKRKGQRVEIGEPVVEVSSDKIDAEVPAPATGVLTRIVVNEDETADIGSVLGVIAAE